MQLYNICIVFVSVVLYYGCDTATVLIQLSGEYILYPLVLTLLVLAGCGLACLLCKCLFLFTLDR